MNPISSLLAGLEKLITEHGSSAILKERIEQLREAIERLEKENARLQTELRQLQDENRELHKQLEEKSFSDEFLEHRGALFRRLQDGSIQDEVYCATCKHPMTSLGSMLPFSCSVCDRDVNFTGSDLNRIIAEINP